MEVIKTFFESSPEMAWGIVSIMLAMLAMAILWDKIKWWWLNTSMSFPLIGFIARNAKNLKEKNNGWFESEHTLSEKYKQQIQPISQEQYNKYATYLLLSGDEGQHTLPKLLLVIVVLLVFFEAMGFSYVLAGYTIPGASENNQQIAGYAIAFIVSVLLVFLTHFSGHEIYRSNKIKHERREWNEDKTTYEAFNGKHPLGINDVKLEDDQLIDQAEPQYSRRINRIQKKHPSYVITIATLIFVTLVAVGATYVRGKVLDKQLDQEVTGQIEELDEEESLSDDMMDFTNESTDSDALVLPDEDMKEAREASINTIKRTTDIDKDAGWGTFILLAVIFLFLQLLGILIGFKWAFAGKNSKAAYKAIKLKKFGTYDELKRDYERVCDAAQSKLQVLQSKMSLYNAKKGSTEVNFTKTFYDFLSENDDRISAKQSDSQQLDVEKVYKHYIGLSDEAQQTYIETLSEIESDALIEKIKMINQRKAQFESLK